MWVKDKSPVVETNIGFVEHYVDPEKKRATWEGFVAIVNKERSKKLANLVSKNKEIITLLPRDKQLETDNFIAPDFTSLDVVTFGGDKMPQGINIPNYNDIREKIGFKNVVFENNKPNNRSEWETIDYIKTEEE